MSSAIQIIELWPVYAECWICEVEHLGKQGIPVYEGLIVPDEYQGEWGGVPVCEDCFEVVRRLQRASPNNCLTKRTVEIEFDRTRGRRKK